MSKIISTLPFHKRLTISKLYVIIQEEDFSSCFYSVSLSIKLIKAIRRFIRAVTRTIFEVVFWSPFLLGFRFFFCLLIVQPPFLWCNYIITYIMLSVNVFVSLLMLLLSQILHIYFIYIAQTMIFT